MAFVLSRRGPDGALIRQAQVRCDKCGVTSPATRPDGKPCAWAVKGRAPPRWLHLRDIAVDYDFCPKCRRR